MNVTAPRKIWTGDRLDGLEKKVDDGFAQIDERFEKVDERFEKLEGKVDARFDKVDERFDRLNERITYLTGGLFSAAVVIIATLIAL